MDLTKLRKGVRIGAAALTLVVAAGGSAALASYDATNTATGNRSTNNSVVRANNTMTERHSNVARANNALSVNANSGDNDANGNTEDGRAEGGSVMGSVNVKTVLNSGDGAGMPFFMMAEAPDVTVGNTQTGRRSDNNSSVVANTTNRVTVTNNGAANNSLAGSVRTGNNDANGNTGNGTAEAGSINVAAGFHTDINSASSTAVGVAGAGSAQAGDVKVSNERTGNRSTNNATAVVNTTNEFTQTNTGTVNNNIALDLQSGNNDANGNTGDGTAEGGSITFDLDVTNYVN